jgi:hypothetical protein
MTSFGVWPALTAAAARGPAPMPAREPRDPPVDVETERRGAAGGKSAPIGDEARAAGPAPIVRSLFRIFQIIAKSHVFGFIRLPPCYRCPHSG